MYYFYFILLYNERSILDCRALPNFPPVAGGGQRIHCRADGGSGGCRSYLFAGVLTGFPSGYGWLLPDWLSEGLPAARYCC